jgi:hypothetical protein
MGGPQKGSGRVRDNNVYYQKVVIVFNWQAIKNRDVGSLLNSHRRRKQTQFFKHRGIEVPKKMNNVQDSK